VRIPEANLRPERGNGNGSWNAGKPEGNLSRDRERAQKLPRHEKKLSLRNVIRPADSLGRGEKMPSGKVIWFDAVRGYGFIKPDSGESDILVHLHELEKSHLRGLVEGQRISFDVEPSPMNGRPAACNIRGDAR
jgi:cold shock protein